MLSQTRGDWGGIKKNSVGHAVTTKYMDRETEEIHIESGI